MQRLRLERPVVKRLRLEQPVVKRAGQWFDREPLLEPDPERCPDCWCGVRMKAIGRGKFPFSCRSQALWPDAMIYVCVCDHDGWTHQYSPWMEEANGEDSG